MRLERLDLDSLSPLAHYALTVNPPPSFIYGDTAYYRITPAALAWFNLQLHNMRRRLKEADYDKWRKTYDRFNALEGEAHASPDFDIKAYRQYLTDGHAPLLPKPYAPTVLYPDEEPPRIHWRDRWHANPDNLPSTPNLPIWADRTHPCCGFFPMGYQTSHERRLEWVNHLHAQGVPIPPEIVSALNLDPLTFWQPCQATQKDLYQ